MPARSTSGLRVERESTKRTPKPKTVAVPIVENDYAAAYTVIANATSLVDGTWEYDWQMVELRSSIAELGQLSEHALEDDFTEVYATAYDGADWADPNWVEPAAQANADPGYVEFYVGSAELPVAWSEKVSPA